MVRSWLLVTGASLVVASLIAPSWAQSPPMGTQVTPGPEASASSTAADAAPVALEPPDTRVANRSDEGSPATRPYEDGAPIPPGYRVVQRERTGLTKTGWVFFGIGAWSAALGLILMSSPEYRDQSDFFLVIGGVSGLFGLAAVGIGSSLPPKKLLVPEGARVSFAPWATRDRLGAGLSVFF